MVWSRGVKEFDGVCWVQVLWNNLRYEVGASATSELFQVFDAVLDSYYVDMCVRLKRIGECAVNFGVICIVKAEEIFDHERNCSGKVVMQLAFSADGLLDDEVRVSTVLRQDVKSYEHLGFGVEQPLKIYAMQCEQ